MKLKIVYDNEAKLGFKKGWGFSCLIEMEDEKILFDTGWDGNILLSNMEKFGVRPAEIKRAIISHDHWDHAGGLTHIARKDIQLYVPRAFSGRLKGELSSRFELHEVGGAQQICEGIWSTGELGEKTKEQSAVLETKRGLIVIVGCSHPGVRNILSVAARFGKVMGIIGGMHDFNDYDALKGLRLIGPSHCTVNKRKIMELFPEASVEVKAGVEITI
jgi:7,8-dihydropterin-6-yl-methyl-4-(beta-D-ribofuranosyl)aminobenzene 5'-phosphate synthase